MKDWIQRAMYQIYCHFDGKKGVSLGHLTVPSLIRIVCQLPAPAPLRLRGPTEERFFRGCCPICVLSVSLSLI